MKSAITEMKSSLKWLNRRFSQTEKESVILKINQLKLPSLGNRKKKRMKKTTQKPVGIFPAC